MIYKPSADMRSGRFINGEIPDDPADAGSNDARLEEEITHILGEAGDVDASGITHVCRDGVVTLSGSVLDDDERERVVAKVHGAAGVTEVVDRITLIDPGLPDRSL